MNDDKTRVDGFMGASSSRPEQPSAAGASETGAGPHATLPEAPAPIIGIPSPNAGPSFRTEPSSCIGGLSSDATSSSTSTPSSRPAPNPYAGGLAGVAAAMPANANESLERAFGVGFSAEDSQVDLISLSVGSMESGVQQIPDSPDKNWAAEADTLERAHAAEELGAKAAAERGGRRPLICVTPCWQPGAGERTSSNEYATDMFLEAIVAAGGVPVIMPITSDPALISHYVQLCDGFALPGGAGPDPSLWGEDPSGDKTLSDPRDALEIPLIRAIIEADKPLLAICRGEQLLNFVLGGTVSRDLMHVPCPLMGHWKHWGAHWEPVHEVIVEPGTLLSRCVGGRERLKVNSNHRQCAMSVGEGVVDSGHATDAVIEAVELTRARFCLGVQWHPEYTWTTQEADAAIWRSFVSAAAGLWSWSSGTAA